MPSPAQRSLCDSGALLQFNGVDWQSLATLPGVAIVVHVSVRAAKKSSQENIPLMAGDVVSVEETPATFAVGLLRQFFSVGVSSRVPF